MCVKLINLHFCGQDFAVHVDEDTRKQFAAAKIETSIGNFDSSIQRFERKSKPYSCSSARTGPSRKRTRRPRTLLTALVVAAAMRAGLPCRCHSFAACVDVNLVNFLTGKEPCRGVRMFAVCPGGRYDAIHSDCLSAKGEQQPSLHASESK